MTRFTDTVKMLREAVVDFFRDTLPNSSKCRILLYWVKLCDRLDEQAHNDDLGDISALLSYQHLLASVEEAHRFWTSMLSNLQESRNQFTTKCKDLDKLEYGLYVGLTALVEESGDRDLYLADRPSPNDPVKDTYHYNHPSMVASRLFWLRSFGIGLESREIDEFCTALALYLRLEFPTKLFFDPLFKSALQHAINPWKNEMGVVSQPKNTVSRSTWRLFAWRMGPLRDMYEKVVSVTEIDEKDNSVRCAPWFTDNARLQMQIHLAALARENEHNQRHFLIRPGHDHSTHAYTFTFLQNKTHKSSKIFYVKSNESDYGRQYAIPTVAGKPKMRFDTLGELCVTVVKSIAWHDESQQVLHQVEKWNAHAQEVAASEDEDRMLNDISQQMKALGIDQSHVPSAPTRNKGEIKRSIDSALQSVASFSEYLGQEDMLENKGAADDAETQMIKKCFRDYKYKHDDGSKEPLVHLLVRKAAQSKEWLPLLQKLFECHVLPLSLLSTEDAVCGTPVQWLLRRAGNEHGGWLHLREVLEWIIMNKSVEFMAGALFDIYEELTHLFAASVVPSNPPKRLRSRSYGDSKETELSLKELSDLHAKTREAYRWFLSKVCRRDKSDNFSQFKDMFYSGAIAVIANMTKEEEFGSTDDDGFHPERYVAGYERFVREDETVPPVLRALGHTLSCVMECIYPEDSRSASIAEPKFWRMPTSYSSQFAAADEKVQEKKSNALEVPMSGDHARFEEEEDKAPMPKRKLSHHAMRKRKELTHRRAEQALKALEEAERRLQLEKQKFLGAGTESPVLTIAKNCKTQNPSELLKSFLLWGAPFDVVDGELRTPLHYMAEYCNNYSVQDWSDLLPEHMPSLRNVINHRDQTNLTPLGILYNKEVRSELELDMMFCLIIHGATIQGLDLDDAEASKSRSKKTPFASLLSEYLKGNEWARWYVLKAAIDNEDLLLAKIILKPKSNMVLPYMLKPKYIFDCPIWLRDLERAKKVGAEAYETEDFKTREARREEEDKETLKMFTTLYAKDPRDFDDLHVHDYVEQSMLHFAVQSRRRNPKIVEMILEYDAASQGGAPGPGSQSLSTEFMTPLQQARENVIYSAMQNKVRTFCSAPNLDYVDAAGRTVLHVACCQPSMKTTDAIADLLIGQVNIREKDNKGFTSLHYATFYGRLHVVDRLIQAHSTVGAISGVEEEITKKREFDKQQALQEAAADQTKSFWDRVCADTKDDMDDVVDEDEDGNFYGGIRSKVQDDALEQRIAGFKPLGRTALHVAALNGDWQICSSLISRQKELVNGLDNEGWTPLALALYMRMKLKELRDRPSLIHPVIYRKIIRRHKKAEKNTQSQRDLVGLQEMAAIVQYMAELEDQIDTWEKRPVRAAALEAYKERRAELAVRAEQEVQSVIRQKSAEKEAAENADESAPLNNSNGASSTADLPKGTARLKSAPEIEMTNKTFFAVQLEEEEDKDPVMRQLMDDNPWLVRREQMLISSKTEVDLHVNVQALCKRWIKDYDATIDILLRGGSDIKQSTTACSKEIRHLVDIEEYFSDLHEQVSELERKQNAATKTNSAKAALYKHQREGIFEDKSNQIVIDQYFSTYVSPKQRRKLYRYTFMLIVLTLLGIYETTRDEQASFFLHRVMKETLIDDEFDFPVSQLKRTFRDIDAKDEFWLWAKGPFLDVFYPKEVPRFWEGNTETPRSAASFSSGGFIHDQNRVVGVPRIRQVRSRAVDCKGLPDDFKTWARTCFDSANTDPETASFGPSLDFTYSSGKKLESLSTFGRANWYEAGGYVTEFPALTGTNARNDTLNVINGLQNSNWIDSKTRAVFVEFTVFNANLVFFVHGNIMVEFPRSGGTVPSWEFTVGQFRRYLSPTDFFALALEIIVVFYFIADFVFMLQVTNWETKRFGWYFVVYVFMNVFIIFAVILHLIAFVWGLNAEWTGEDFVPAYRIARVIKLEASCISIVVFLGWLRLLNYLSVWRTFSRLLVMITMMIRELGDFLILFAIVISCFASAEYIAYGYSQEHSYTWFFGLLTRVSWTFAGRDIDSFVGTDRIMGTLYALLFVVTINLLLLNLVIAMMNSAYEAARAKSGESYWARKQYELTIQYSWDREMLEGGLLQTCISLKQLFCGCCPRYSSFGEKMKERLNRCWEGTKKCARVALHAVAALFVGLFYIITCCNCCKKRRNRAQSVRLLHLPSALP